MEPTPMMAQWHSCKEKAKDALLLFRLGDFYEAFYEDAQIISKEIGLTLTARQGIPMCGVPFHSSESYIDKLVAKKYKVAIAEQVEDPKATKGLVRREIVRTVSLGTVINSTLLSDKKNNYFVSLSQIGSLFGLAALDITTGEFRTLETEKLSDLESAVYRLRPPEILASNKFKTTHSHFFNELSHSFGFILNEKEDWRFDPKSAQTTLIEHFNTHSLDPFGFKGQLASIAAAGALLSYLKRDLNIHLDHVRSITSDLLQSYMSIDKATLKNLEIVESNHAHYTLLNLLDQTATAMGARLLSHWVKHPLLTLPQIEERQLSITDFLHQFDEAYRTHLLLKEVRDLERLFMKMTMHYGTPKDLLALGLSLSKCPEIQHALSPFTASQITYHRNFIIDPISETILSALNDNPPLRIGEGDIFKDGYHPELDRLRSLSRDAISWMSQYQSRLREETGIKTLKVGFTKAFGYYIEVTHAQKEKIPPFFHRKQTLTNGERYITEELKVFEHQALTAEERSKALESELFEDLRKKVCLFGEKIYQTAKAIAHIDSLLALSITAHKYKWTKPLLDTSSILEIKEGRHPIVEYVIGKSEFIANETSLSDTKQLMLITGPNMAGKSTYIRQVALIVILAQIGSYVPAESAHIGLVDKIFSRIGASDDLARGQSTFMVEMSETANILNNATSRSLVLLDEIGRGTSTYDGIAIAWSVAEYLVTTPEKKAKTLFATHYWELTRLAQEFKTAMNYQVAVQETADTIVFLRKIIPGGTDKSYGIHVAKLAGLPKKAIQRAEAMLAELEKGKPKKKKEFEQLTFSIEEKPPSQETLLLNRLKEIDINQLSPIDALLKLSEFKTLINH